MPIHVYTLEGKTTFNRVRHKNLAQNVRGEHPFQHRPTSHFFASRTAARLDEAQVRLTFYRLSRQIGIRGISASHGPRLHDFRHRFAVQTLVRWYRTGEDVRQRLPILSTYLGHSHVTDTYWYVTSTPELMAAAGNRLDKRWEGLG